MTRAGPRPPDRVERARVRADGAPEVGQQRAWNQPLAGAIDIVIDGTPVEKPHSDEGPALGEPPADPE